MENEIFKEKRESITYKKYPNRSTLIRQIKLSVPIAESINVVIQVFKNETKGIKMDSNVLIEVAITHYFNYLNSIDNEDKAIEQLKEDTLKGFKNGVLWNVFKKRILWVN